MLRASAEKGDLKSCSLLGSFYMSLGMYSDAVMWLEKASAGGDPGAAASLGMILEEGQKDVAADPKRALIHYQRAWEGKIPSAADGASRCAAKLGLPWPPLHETRPTIFQFFRRLWPSSKAGGKGP